MAKTLTPRELQRRRQLSERTRRWNADHTHQQNAGRARAATFTTEYQTAAGHASFDAFSARWRAEQGIAPLSAHAAARYLTLAHIKLLGQQLADCVRQQILAAWSAGDLRGVADFLAGGEPERTAPAPAAAWRARLWNEAQLPGTYAEYWRERDREAAE